MKSIFIVTVYPHSKQKSKEPNNYISPKANASYIKGGKNILTKVITIYPKPLFLYIKVKGRVGKTYL
jgi:hypothetical protein